MVGEDEALDALSVVLDETKAEITRDALPDVWGDPTLLTQVYQNLIGKFITLPVIGRRIPIIADSFVDPEFGSGAVKVTPSHDPNDFEMGRRHDLEFVRVIGEDGTMTEAAGNG